MQNNSVVKDSWNVEINSKILDMQNSVVKVFFMRRTGM